MVANYGKGWGIVGKGGGNVGNGDCAFSSFFYRGRFFCCYISFSFLNKGRIFLFTRNSCIFSHFSYLIELIVE